MVFIIYWEIAAQDLLPCHEELWLEFLLRVAYHVRDDLVYGIARRPCTDQFEPVDVLPLYVGPVGEPVLVLERIQGIEYRGEAKAVLRLPGGIHDEVVVDIPILLEACVVENRLVVRGLGDVDLELLALCRVPDVLEAFLHQGAFRIEPEVFADVLDDVVVLGFHPRL